MLANIALVFLFHNLDWDWQLVCLKQYGDQIGAFDLPRFSTFTVLVVVVLREGAIDGPGVVCVDEGGWCVWRAGEMSTMSLNDEVHTKRKVSRL
jgi:hypothetical protein